MTFAFLAAGLAASTGEAALITFDTAISGQTSFSFDGDGDTINDVIFSTTDPSGFNTVGPGTNMSYIQQPGLEGTTQISPDLRVDFLNGATGSLGFAFAMSTGTGGVFGVLFDVYAADNTLLASDFVTCDFTLPNGVNPSSFPEGLLSVSFAGEAAYALFDFDSGPARYIIDNFEGTFGSTETAVPEPSSLALAGLGAVGLIGLGRRRRGRADGVGSSAQAA
jgi:hypothetical protein